MLLSLSVVFFAAIVFRMAIKVFLHFKSLWERANKGEEDLYFAYGIAQRLKTTSTFSSGEKNLVEGSGGNKSARWLLSFLPLRE